MNTKFLNGAWRVILALVFSLSLVGISTGRVSAGGAFIVTSLAEGSDATPGDGICDTGGGLCTLRAAMQEANAYAGADTINFDLSGTITLTSTLPIIYEQLTIDGIGRDVTISGNNLYRVLWVGESINVSLDHLSIVNGHVTGIPGGGGGILNYGTLSVTNCTFSGNQALKGGGIYSDTGTLQVFNSTFDVNSATQYGGALGINDGSLAVENSTFSGNTSSIDGGAIWGDQNVGTNTMTVTNSTFSGNSATGYGGGVENLYGTLTVTNSTFSGNGAGYGGGIDDQGNLHLKNTILANSTSGGDCRSAGGLASDVKNLIESNNNCGTPFSSADPKLGPLADHGGNTDTFALRTGSPAIDAGDDTTCAAAPVDNLDQRSVARPQGAHCDIGSYEKVPGNTYFVTITDDSGTGSLRQAILDANANMPIEDTINFSVSGMITLGSTLPVITDDLIIDASGYSITISGNNLYRVMRISSGMSVTLNLLGIYGGLASGGTGGGVENGLGALTVTYCSFSGNSATWGGAIANSGGTLTVTNSTFSSNNGTYGSGIYTQNGTATIANSTFSGNNATQAGAGIESYQGSLTVTNSTFSGNSATTSGGGIDNYQGTLTVANSTFSDNGAATGGGINNDNNLYLMNTILANATGGGDCSSSVALAADTNNLIVSNNGCGTPLSSTDPNLGPLASNGGPTQTMAVMPGSPAVDAGDDATCAAVPVSGHDQRGVTRPFGTHCDIGSFEFNKGTLTTRSVGLYDGWILESGENSNIGGTRDSAATTFNLGDEVGDKQYRAVLSFNTASLPDTAVITKVTLKIKRPATGYLVGYNNPFIWGLGLKVDMRKPFFGTTAALVITDFQAAAGKSAVATFSATPAAYWYSAVLNAAGRAYVNKTGTTQFRLRFFKDDNNDNAADYMMFYSGNYATATSRPTLIIEYYVP